MKKIISVLLVLVMALGMLAACGAVDNVVTVPTDHKTPTNPTDPTDPVTPDAGSSASSLEVLNNIFGKYSETELFPMAGGAGENINWEGPAGIDMATNGVDLSWIIYVPETELSKVTGAATVIHAMNANTFSCGALQMSEGTDVKAFAETMKNSILGTQWMCGFPEKLLIAVVNGDQVVVAFGHDNEEAPLITTFQTHLTEAYPDAEILYVENIGA